MDYGRYGWQGPTTLSIGTVKKGRLRKVIKLRSIFADKNVCRHKNLVEIFNFSYIRYVMCKKYLINNFVLKVLKTKTIKRLKIIRIRIESSVYNFTV